MSEREPEPDNVDDEPDHTDDPREQDTGKGYPETAEEGAADEDE